MRLNPVILRYSAPLLLLLYAVSSAANADAIDAPADFAPPIRAVQLYAAEALIAREGAVPLKPGVNRVRLADLPAGLNEATLRASLAAEGARIEEIRFRTKHKPAYASEAARNAENALRDAESKLRRLTDRYSALKRESANLAQLPAGQIPPGDPAPTLRIEPQRWSETLNFIQSQLAKNDVALAELLPAIDAAREELLVAIAVADRYRSAAARSVKEAVITFNYDPPAGARVETAPLRFEYRIGGAAWFPSYRAQVRTDGAASTVRLASYALVRNQTGEDWRNARLSFSAADPEESGDLGRLAEWRIRARIVAADVASADDNRSGGPGGAGRATMSESRRASNAPSPQPSAGAPAEFAADEEQSLSPMAESAGESDRRDEGGVSGRFQDRLEVQRARSFNYYNENARQVQEAQANQRNMIANTALRTLEQSVRARDAALGRSDFAGAVQQSDAVIESVQRLDPRFQERFAEEIQSSRRVRQQALNMLEYQRILGMLAAPSQSSRGFDYRFVAPTPESIPSEPGFTQVFLSERELPLQLSYEVNPSAQPWAYLTGRSKHSEAQPLLSGPVFIYHNRDYVGEALLATVAAGQNFALNLGASDDIKVVRREDEKRDTSGLFTNVYRAKRETLVTITNRKRLAITLDVFERTPVSGDERVKIENVSFSETPAESRAEYGLHRFRMELAAGAQRTLTIRYDISHPETVLPQFLENSSPEW